MERLTSLKHLVASGNIETVIEVTKEFHNITDDINRTVGQSKHSTLSPDVRIESFDNIRKIIQIIVNDFVRKNKKEEFGEAFPYVAMVLLSEREKMIEYFTASDAYGFSSIPPNKKPNTNDHDNFILDWQSKFDYKQWLIEYYINTSNREILSFDPRKNSHRKKYNWIDLRENRKDAVSISISVPLIGLGNALNGIILMESEQISFNDDIKDKIFDLLCLIKYEVEDILQKIEYLSIKTKIDRLNSYLSDFSRRQFTYKNVEEIGKGISKIFSIISSFVNGEEELFILLRYGNQLIYDPLLDNRLQRTQKKYDGKVSFDSLKMWGDGDKNIVVKAAEDRISYYLPFTTCGPLSKHYLSADDDTASQITFPIIYQNRMLGVMNISSRYPYAFFGSDRKLLYLFSAVAALMLFQSQGSLEMKNLIHKIGSKNEDLNDIYNFLLTLRDPVSIPDKEDLQFCIDAALETKLFAESLHNFSISSILSVESSTPTNICDVINNLITKKYNALIETNSIVIVNYPVTYDGSASNPEVFLSEKPLEIMFGNFITNALYSMQNSSKKILTITIKDSKNLLGLEGRERYQKGYTVTIADTGSGFDAKVPQEHTDSDWALHPNKKIFSYRGRGTNSYLGMGLGLWINDQIISSLNGRISYTSDIGLGSSFSVFLPINVS